MSTVTHRWYARPVFFVADLNRALHFYIDQLGFAKQWHEGDGAGRTSWWGYDVVQVDDPDGNELMFPCE